MSGIFFLCAWHNFSGGWFHNYIIIYGKNCCDETIDNKYFQLINLGYIEEKLFIYYVGLLEWCLLQDVYDDANFPTTNKCVDILRFRGNRVMHN